MGGVTIHLTRTHALSASTLLLLALWTAGCGGTTEPEPDKEVPHVQPQPDAQHLLRAPRDLPTKSGSHDPYDVGDPAVGNLYPDLLESVQAAAADARDDGVPMSVTSGWRSREQQHLFDEAVDEYGSEEEAVRWVSTPETSAHVTGDAVDLGPTDAMSWLSQHGSD